MDRLACLQMEERMRPGPPAQPPAQYLGDCAQQQRQIDASRASRRLTDRVFAKDRAERRTEYRIDGSRAAIEDLRMDTDEGNCRPQRVAHRGVAAGRVPAEQAFWRQA